MAKFLCSILMNFEKNSNPHRALRIGSGRARKMFNISKGAGFMLADKEVIELLERWQKTGKPPIRLYPLMEMAENRRQFVEPDSLSGEIIEWKGQIYSLP